MSDDNEDYLDDPEILDFNEEVEEEEDEEANELKDIGSQLEKDDEYFYNLGDKKSALKKSPSPIVFEQVAKAPPRAKAVKGAVKPMTKAKPPQQSRKKYYDDDDDAVKPRSSKNAELLANKEAIYDAEVKKLWTMWVKRHGNIPPWYQRKGGTRKRSTRRRGGAYKKRTTRKRMRKHATRRRR